MIDLFFFVLAEFIYSRILTFSDDCRYKLHLIRVSHLCISHICSILCIFPEIGPSKLNGLEEIHFCFYLKVFTWKFSSDSKFFNDNWNYDWHSLKFWIPDKIKMISPRKIIKAHQLKSSCVIFFFFNSEPIPKIRKPVKKHKSESPTSKSFHLFKYTERITKNAPTMPTAKKILINIFSVLK